MWYCGKDARFEVGGPRFQSWLSPLSISVTLDKFLDLPGLSFLICKKGVDSATCSLRSLPAFKLHSSGYSASDKASSMFSSSGISAYSFNQMTPIVEVNVMVALYLLTGIS